MTDLASKIDQLGQLLTKHGLTCLKVHDGEVFIEVRRDSPTRTSSQAPMAQQAVVAERNDLAGEIIPSPMIGTFYRRPLPTEPVYIEEGERISVGQVIGVIEAMKVFNEVESPIAGIVKKFLVESGTLVQEGDPLVLVEP